MPNHRAGPARFAITAVATLVVATVAAAQGLPDLNVLALYWAHGEYISPLICDVGGEPTRGVRRFHVGPGPRSRRPPVANLVVDDLEADDAARCFDELGVSQLNIVGNVEFRLPGHSRPDMAARDFKTQLRRKRGFEFSIAGGKLEIGAVGEPRRPLSVRGGKLRIHAVEDGTDLSRVLSDLRGRKLAFEIEAPDGTTLRLPAVGEERPPLR